MTLEEFEKYKRRPDKILASVKKKANYSVFSEKVTVYFPSRYKVKNMCTIGTVTTVAGYFMIANEKKEYTVFNLPNLISLSPDKIEEINIGDVYYMKLTFEAGSIFNTNNKLVQAENFLYFVFDEFLALGKSPFFFGETDLANIFSLANKYAGSRLGNGPLGLDTITSVVLRDADDLDTEYRLTDKKKRPTNIGLANVHHTFQNVYNKINAAHASAGIGSAVLLDKKEISPLEEVLA